MARTLAGTRTAVTYTGGRGNLVPNPDFELSPAFVAAQTATVKWIDGSSGGSGSARTAWNWAFFSKNGTASCQFDNSTSFAGSNSMKVSTLATASSAAVRPYLSTTVPDLTLFGIPAFSSTKYTLSVAIKTTVTSGSSTGAALLVDEFAAGSTTLLNRTTLPTSSVNTTTNWTVYSTTITTRSTTAVIGVALNNTGNAGAGTLIMDAWFDSTVVIPTTLSRTAAGSRNQVT